MNILKILKNLFQSSLKAKISIDRTLKEVVEDGWEEDEDYIMWPN